MQWKNYNQLFIAGIGTDVGKTVASAILANALGADYWKPIQCGDLGNTDSHKISRWTKAIIYQEAYRLKKPMSPHAAAKYENVKIQLNDFSLPFTQNKLIIEGAGGLMVPINDRSCILDIIKRLNVAVVLVSKHYLGSINHTLLSIDILQKRNIPIAGIIYNGVDFSNDYHKETQSIIEKISGVACLFEVPQFSIVNRDNIAEFIQKKLHSIE